MLGLWPSALQHKPLCSFTLPLGPDIS